MIRVIFTSRYRFSGQDATIDARGRCRVARHVQPIEQHQNIGIEEIDILRGAPEGGGSQESRKAYADGGWEGFFRQSRQFQLAAYSQGKPVAYEIAQTYARLNQRDQAFYWLDRALEDRELNTGWTKVDPILDPLRTDPRFAALLKRLGFTA